METRISVAKDGDADFRRIGDALAALGDAPRGSARIAVGRGVYEEKIRITRPDLHVEGAGMGATVVRWDDSAARLLPDGERMGTFNSYVAYVGAPGVSLEGLTIENSAGDGRIVGQAVALYADADRLSFTRCAILGRQDSLFTGPLPKDPVPKGVNLVHPVAGLGEELPELPFRQLYRECLVAGDVDFIFGSALAVFEGCEIRSLPRGEATYVTAPSTYPGQEVGFVFLNCSLTGPGVEPGAAYLGRPWRNHARAAFIGCELGAHIASAGWDDWEKPEARLTARFAERGSTGPGARMGSRAPWARALSAEEAAYLASDGILWPEARAALGSVGPT
jgi:pectinesterase